MNKNKKKNRLQKTRTRRISNLNRELTSPSWITSACLDGRTLKMAAVGSVMLSASVASNLHALPTGGVVAGGSATITSSQASMLIKQMTDRALINWKGYSIDVNELVKYMQPSSSSIAVNRVLGGDPSLIFGSLTANGRIFLINPNGILFGSTASINTAGLLATTLDLKDIDLKKNKYSFAQDRAKAASYVINRGTININGNGFLVLMAPAVSNEGLIIANLGKVALGAGDKLAVDFLGNGIINYVMEGKVLDQVKGPDGQPLTSAVSNSGTIQAEGGQVVLTASASNAALSSVINQSGVIEAKSIVDKAGEIVLSGGAEGVVLNTGTLDVSGSEARAAGGAVTMTGAAVGQFGAIHADGMGAAGGGAININATDVIALGTGSLTTANAGTDGNGGIVSVVTPGAALFASGAVIEAKGGSNSGDGGYVEVSGKEYVDIEGTVNTSAPHGKTGMFLIDPTSITIGDDDTEGLSYDDDDGIWAASGDPLPTESFLSVTSLNETLALSNVTVTTASEAAGVGDITVYSVSMTAVSNGGTGYSLTLLADHNITIDSPITLTGATNGTSTLTLKAGNNLEATEGTITSTETGVITAGNLIADSLTGISMADVRVSALAARIGGREGNETAEGDIDITNTGDLTLTDLDGWGYAVQNSGAGSISINTFSDLTVTDDVLAAGGDIFLGSDGSITLTGASVHSQMSVIDNDPSAGDGTATSGNVSLDAGGDININGGSSVYSNAFVSINLGSGNATATAGNVSLQAGGDINIENDSSVHSSADASAIAGQATATAGDVSLNAGGDITMSGDIINEESPSIFSYARANANPGYSGYAYSHEVSLTAAGDITLQGGAEVYSEAKVGDSSSGGTHANYAQASSGCVSLTAGSEDLATAGSITIDDQSAVYSRAWALGYSAYARSYEVSLTAADSISVLGGSSVYAYADAQGQGTGSGYYANAYSGCVSLTAGSEYLAIGGSITIDGQGLVTAPVDGEEAVGVWSYANAYILGGSYTHAYARSYEVSLTATDDINIRGGAQVESEAEAMIGTVSDYNHAEAYSGCVFMTAGSPHLATTGNITIDEESSVSSEAYASGCNAYARSYEVSLAATGSISVLGVSSVYAEAEADSQSVTGIDYAQAYSGCVFMTAGSIEAATTGNITIDEESSVSSEAYASGCNAYARSYEVSLAATGNITVQGVSSVYTSADAYSLGGNYNYAEAYAGCVFLTAGSPYLATSGNITIGGDEMVGLPAIDEDGFGGVWSYASAYTAGGSYTQAYAESYEVSLAAKGDITVQGGTEVKSEAEAIVGTASDYNYARAYSGCVWLTAGWSLPATTGNITIDEGSSVYSRANALYGCHAYARSYEVSLSATGNITVQGGSSVYAEAVAESQSLNHIDYANAYSGCVYLTAGSSDLATTGSITIDGTGAPTASVDGEENVGVWSYAYASSPGGGNNTYAYARSYEVSLTATGDINIHGGAVVKSEAEAYVGGISLNNAEAYSGCVSLTAGSSDLATTGSIAIDGASSVSSEAYASSYGYQAYAYSDEVSLTATGSITVQGGSNVSSYAEAGNLQSPSDSDYAQASSGCVSLTAGSSELATTGSITIDGGSSANSQAYASGCVAYAYSDEVSLTATGSIAVQGESAVYSYANAYSENNYAQASSGCVSLTAGSSDLATTGNITIDGGSSVHSQVNAWGCSASAYSNDVSLTATGSITVQGDSNVSSGANAYGQGSNYDDQAYAGAGEVLLTAGGDITIGDELIEASVVSQEYGSHVGSDAFAQGCAAYAQSNDVSLTAGGSITVQGGSSVDSYAEAVAEGISMNGAEAGAGEVSLVAGGDITIGDEMIVGVPWVAQESGSHVGSDAFAYGCAAYAESNDVSLTAAGTITVQDGSEIHSYAEADANFGSDGRATSGDVTLTADNILVSDSTISSLAELSYVEVYDGEHARATSGDVSLTANEDIILSGSEVFSEAGIGDLGYIYTGTDVMWRDRAAISATSGDVELFAGDDISLTESSVSSFARVGYIEYPEFPIKATSGDVTFTATGDITLSSSEVYSEAAIGDLGYFVTGSGVMCGYSDSITATSGDVALTAGGSTGISLTDSSVYSIARIGFIYDLGIDAINASSGNVSLAAANGSIDFSGSAVYSLAQAGYFTGCGSMDVGEVSVESGDVSLTAYGSISVEGGSAVFSVAEVGYFDNALVDSAYVFSGEVTLNAGSDISVDGGSGVFSWASAQATGGNMTAIAASGDVGITAGGAMTVSGESEVFSYAEAFDPDHAEAMSGNVSLTGGSITITDASVESETYAEGSINDSAISMSGNVSLTATDGDITIEGGEVYSQAHAWDDYDAQATSGDVSLTASGDINIGQYVEEEADPIDSEIYSVAGTWGGSTTTLVQSGNVSLVAGGAINAGYVLPELGYDDGEVFYPFDYYALTVPDHSYAYVSGVADAMAIAGGITLEGTTITLNGTDVFGQSIHSCASAFGNSSAVAISGSISITQTEGDVEVSYPYQIYSQADAEVTIPDASAYATSGDVSISAPDGDLTLTGGQVYSYAYASDPNDAYATAGDVSLTAGGNIDIEPYIESTGCGTVEYGSLIYSLATVPDTAATALSVESGNISLIAGGSVNATYSSPMGEWINYALTLPDHSYAYATGAPDATAVAGGITLQGTSITLNGTDVFAQSIHSCAAAYGFTTATATSGSISITQTEGDIEIDDVNIFSLADAVVGGVSCAYATSGDVSITATNGGITLSDAYVFSHATGFDPELVDARAGNVSLTAGDGNIIAEEGSGIFSLARAEGLVVGCILITTASVQSGDVSLVATGSIDASYDDPTGPVSCGSYDFYAITLPDHAYAYVDSVTNATAIAGGITLSGTSIALNDAEIFSVTNGAPIYSNAMAFGTTTATAISGSIDLTQTAPSSVIILASDSPVYSNAYAQTSNPDNTAVAQAGNVSITATDGSIVAIGGQVFSRAEAVDPTAALATAGNVSLNADGDIIAAAGQDSPSIIYSLALVTGGSTTALVQSGNVSLVAGGKIDVEYDADPTDAMYNFRAITLPDHAEASVLGWQVQVGVDEFDQPIYETQYVTNATAIAGGISLSGTTITLNAQSPEPGALADGTDVFDKGIFSCAAAFGSSTATATSGNISITQTGLTPGEEETGTVTIGNGIYSRAYAQAPGTLAYAGSGDVSVTVTNGNVTVDDTVIRSYAQAYNAGDTYAEAGNVSLNVGGSLTLTGDSWVGSEAYSEGGVPESTSHTVAKDVSITAGGSITIVGESEVYSYVEAGGPANTEATAGNVTLTAGTDGIGPEADGVIGDITISGGSWVGSEAYAASGNSAIATAGDVTLNATGSITVENGSEVDSYAEAARDMGEPAYAVATAGNVGLTAGGDITVTGASEFGSVYSWAYADASNGEEPTAIAVSGDVTLDATGGSITVQSGAEVFSYAEAYSYTGYGAFSASNCEEPTPVAIARSVDVMLSATNGNITIQDSSVYSEADAESSSYYEDVAIAVGGNVLLTATGSVVGPIAQDDEPETVPASITIDNSWVGSEAYAYGCTGIAISNDVSLSADGSITIQGDSHVGSYAYAEGGTSDYYGGAIAAAGDVSLNAGGDITIGDAMVADSAPADGYSSYVYSEADTDSYGCTSVAESNDVSLTAAGSITVQGQSEVYSYAEAGGPVNAEATSGNVALTAGTDEIAVGTDGGAGSINIIDGSYVYSETYAEAGDTAYATSKDVFLDATGSITVQGQSEVYSYAEVWRADYADAEAGNVKLTAGGDITIGDAVITQTEFDPETTYGSSVYSWAYADGGRTPNSTSIATSRDVTLDAAGNITVQGESEVYSYTDAESNTYGQANATAGDVTLAAGGDITIGDVIVEEGSALDDGYGSYVYSEANAYGCIATAVSQDVSLTATGSITVQGGSEVYSYAEAYSDYGYYYGGDTVATSGKVSLTAGTGGTDGAVGNITVDNSYVYSEAYAYYGCTTFAASNDVSLAATGNITIQDSDVYSYAYAYAYNGGYYGEEATATAGKVSLTAGTDGAVGFFTIATDGIGGSITVNNSNVYSCAAAYYGCTTFAASGDVSITATGDITIQDSDVYSDAYAYNYYNYGDATATAGNVSLTATGSVEEPGVLEDGIPGSITVNNSNVYSCAAAYYGCTTFAASGDVSITATGDITIQDSDVYSDAYAYNYYYYGDATATAGNVSLTAGTAGSVSVPVAQEDGVPGSITVNNSDVYSQADAYYGCTTSAVSGDVSLAATGDITIQDSDVGSYAYAYGYYSGYYSEVTATAGGVSLTATGGGVTAPMDDVIATGSITVNNSDVYSEAYAYGCAGYTDAASGDVSLSATGSITIQNESDVYSYAYARGGAYNYYGGPTATAANVSLGAGGDITIGDAITGDSEPSGGGGSYVYSEADTESYGRTSSAVSNDVSLIAGGSIAVQGESGVYSYAEAGGPVTADATAGNVTLAAGGDITIGDFVVEEGEPTVAQYGYGSSVYSETYAEAGDSAIATSRDVTLDAAGSITVQGESEVYSYAEASREDGDPAYAEATAGNVTLAAGGSITIGDSDEMGPLDGEGYGSYVYSEAYAAASWPGFGYAPVAVATSGNVTLIANDDVTIQGGSEVYSAAASESYYDFNGCMAAAANNGDGYSEAMATSGNVVIEAGEEFDLTDSAVYTGAMAYSDDGYAGAYAGSVTISAEGISITGFKPMSSDLLGELGYLGYLGYIFGDIPLSVGSIAVAAGYEGATAITGYVPEALPDQNGEEFSTAVTLNADDHIFIDNGAVASAAIGYSAQDAEAYAGGVDFTTEEGDIRIRSSDGFVSMVGSIAAAAAFGYDADVSTVAESGNVQFTAGGDIDITVEFEEGIPTSSGAAVIGSAALAIGLGCASFAEAESGDVVFTAGGSIDVDQAIVGSIAVALDLSDSGTAEAYSGDVTMAAGEDISLSGSASWGNLLDLFGDLDVAGSIPADFLGDISLPAAIGTIAIAAGPDYAEAESGDVEIRAGGNIEIYTEEEMLPEQDGFFDFEVPGSLIGSGAIALSEYEGVAESGDIAVRAGRNIELDQAALVTAAVAGPGLEWMLSSLIPEAPGLPAVAEDGEAGLYSADAGDITISSGRNIAATATALISYAAVPEGDDADLNTASMGDIALSSGGFMGTREEPLDLFVVGNMLSVAAYGGSGGVSVDINGTVPNDTLVIENLPPGQVILNGRVLWRGLTTRLGGILGPEFQFHRLFEFTNMDNWLFWVVTDNDIHKPVKQ